MGVGVGVGVGLGGQMCMGVVGVSVGVSVGGCEFGWADVYGCGG